MLHVKSGIIGLDLDDTLSGFRAAVHAYHNRMYGTNVSCKDDRVFELRDTWKCSQEDEQKRVYEFFYSPEQENVTPLVGAVEGIKILSANNTLHVITAKPEELRTQTLKWLACHFPNVFADVHFTNFYHGSGRRRSKSEICKELGIEVFVDDALHNARDITNVNIPVLLLDAPWNQGEVEHPITRVFSWEEIVEKLSH